uniref:Thioredoxin family protein n=1 Tax=Fundidesulfovibrio putealis TaxID=270496 RepID=A0A7C4AGP6_9BACT
MEITVLGPGCPKCHEAEKLVREVVADKGVDAKVVKVSDFQEIARMGVFSTPAVAVDGEVKCVGKVPSKAEVAAWITRA